jgi:predicted ArsR family transcriptional regulator
MLIAELSSRPPVSASDEELRSSLGWARTTLLRTLEQLEGEGLVESWNEPSGTGGRPRRLFTTSEPGRHRRG